MDRMFRRGRGSLTIALMLAVLALSAAPAAAAGRGDAGHPGTELWTRLGDWFRETFLPDGIEPGGNGGLREPDGRRQITPGDTSFIDPNGLPHLSADGPPSGDPNG